MKNIKEQLSNTVQSVEYGEFSALEAIASLDDLGKFVDLCKSQIEPAAIDEFDREAEGGKTIKNFKGFKIEKRSGSWTYNFKKVKSYVELEEKLKKEKEKLKQLFLHAECVDPETGEVLEIERKPRADSYIFNKID